MIKLKELLDKTSLKTIGHDIGLDIQIVEGHLECSPLDPDDPRYSVDFILPSMKMVEACRADDFEFFQPWLDAGKMTLDQVQRAAARYHLGKTRSGQPIFWMIDDMLDPLDAHIGEDAWVSTVLKAREPLLRCWRPTHCLFGLHLLNTDLPRRNISVESVQSVVGKNNSRDSCNSCSDNKSISIVESESSAVILSELFPESLWMAYAALPLLSPNLFAPLHGHIVTLYPRADLSCSTFLFFEDLAAEVRKHYDIPISVDPTLEEHATEDQKERGIDLLDFLLEAL